MGCLTHLGTGGNCERPNISTLVSWGFLSSMTDGPYWHIFDVESCSKYLFLELRVKFSLQWTMSWNGKQILLLLKCNLCWPTSLTSNLFPTLPKLSEWRIRQDSPGLRTLDSWRQRWRRGGPHGQTPLINLSTKVSKKFTIYRECVKIVIFKRQFRFVS